MANTQRTGSFTGQGKERGAGTMERNDFGGRGQQNQGMQDEQLEAQGILGRASEMAGNVAGKAGEAASAVAEKARNAASNVGSGIKSLGETIREHGPHTGVLGTASEGVAGTLESTGSFLQEKGLSGVGEELTACIRNFPITSVLVSLSAGYLLGCLTSRR